jgi:hypothetical protein
MTFANDPTRGWGVGGEKRSCVSVVVKYPAAIVPVIIEKSSASKCSYCLVNHSSLTSTSPVQGVWKQYACNFSPPIKVKVELSL